ncbi:hypothetical protein ABW19_dt0205960 [Dactylella cylindrospora]|nr:hypothetical protein ABW19_dt0205960 [Dactylella cylindrospora]
MHQDVIGEAEMAIFLDASCSSKKPPSEDLCCHICPGAQEGADKLDHIAHCVHEFSLRSLPLPSGSNLEYYFAEKLDKYDTDDADSSSTDNQGNLKGLPDLEFDNSLESTDGSEGVELTEAALDSLSQSQGNEKGLSMLDRYLEAYEIDIYAKDLLLQIPTASKDRIEDADAEREKIKEINFVIPFDAPPRYRYFVGRAQELKQVHEYFSDSNPTDTPCVFALVGTGGMGKTQIALEYAYHHRRNYAAIFWVHAESEDAVRISFINIMQRIVLEQARITWPESPPDYQAIGLKLDISGLIDKKGTVSTDLKAVDKIRSALFRWLYLSGKHKWLLIFDDADDLETFAVNDYLPKIGNGAILMTSCRRGIQRTVGGTAVTLEGLACDSAVKLLLQLARLPYREKDNVEHATALVKMLGFMPLAISLAGYSIYRMALSINEYSEYYRIAFKKAQSITLERMSAKTTVTTWEVSFLAIQKQNEEAASLLLTCSYFNPDEIQESLWGVDHDVPKAIQIKKSLSLLASYSLIDYNEKEPGTFSIHPVVQAWARERLSELDSLRFMGCALSRIGDALNREELDRRSIKWSRREEGRMLAHIDVLCSYIEPKFSQVLEHGQGVDRETIFDGIYKVAVALENQGKYDQALVWYQRALDGLEGSGDYDPATFSTTHNIAIIFKKQGKYDKALKQYQQILHRQIVNLGEHHLETLKTMHNMAGIFADLGRYDEALVCHQQALDGYRKVLGENHPDTLNTIHSIGTVFHNWGRYGEALKWFQQALDGYRKVLGDGCLEVLIILQSINSIREFQAGTIAA